MQRRFNYTERVRILQADVSIFLKEQGGVLSFDAELDLEEYGLESGSLVFVEAYRQTAWMRFPWGTVGALEPPDDRMLTEFDTPEKILFRVKVTSNGNDGEEHGLLLAEADRIPLKGPEDGEVNQDPLLPVVPVDLEDRIWEVDFTGRPRLLINRNLGNYREIGSHPSFVSLVYPAVVREVLTQILLVEEHRDYDDDVDVNSKWLRFAVEILGVGEPPELEAGDAAAMDWVGEAVSAFARKHSVVSEFSGFWAREVSQ